MIIDQHVDGHIHTARCHHAVGTMEEYVLAAIDADLRKICFLEHMEEGIIADRITWLSESDFDAYLEEGNTLKKRYEQKIIVELGVEVGYNPEHANVLQKRVLSRNWDRIGLSYHFHKPAGYDRHLNLVSKRDYRLLQLNVKDAGKIEEEYYLTLAEAIDVIPADVICHLDGVLRYHPLRQEMEQPWPLIRSLLDKMKDKGIALEVNTSGLAIRGEIFPERKILAMAAELGIPLVAGSDAHKPEQVGYGFDSLSKHIAVD